MKEEKEEKTSHGMPETPNLWRFCTRKAKYLSLRTFAAKKTVNPSTTGNNLFQCSVHWSW
jgi:hypothetical protein